MKTIIKIVLLSLIFQTSCAKPIYEPVMISFNAPYPTPICMGNNPTEVVLVFDRATLTIPIEEINTGVRSTEPVPMEQGEYKLLEVYTVNEEGEKTSYGMNSYHESGWVVSWVDKDHVYRIYNDKTFCIQLFCDGFWELYNN